MVRFCATAILKKFKMADLWRIFMKKLRKIELAHLLWELELWLAHQIKAWKICFLSVQTHFWKNQDGRLMDDFQEKTSKKWGSSFTMRARAMISTSSKSLQTMLPFCATAILKNSKMVFMNKNLLCSCCSCFLFYYTLFLHNKWEHSRYT